MASNGEGFMEFYQVSSFTDKVFGGNPAGVCIAHGNWPAGTLMQNIAMQLNLSETAFALRMHDGGDGFCRYQIRWFTPTVEVPLCGHATLACAHVLFGKLGVAKIIFESDLHTLPVERRGGMIQLNFPAAKLEKAGGFPSCFAHEPAEAWASADEYLLVFPDEEMVTGAACDLAAARSIDKFGFIITAKSGEPGVDFVSRYFAPKIGIDEDPVTGSAHTLLAPYWGGALGKTELRARQVSKRGGELFLELCGDRVKIAGAAVTFMEGRIFI